MAQRGGMGSGRDADSFYVEDCRKVQTNTHTIQNLTGQISRLVGTLEAEKDFQHCRKMVDDAVRQASETRTILMRIKEHQAQAQNPSEKNNRRMMYQKLSDNLAITARVLEDVVRRFTAEEKKYLASFEEMGNSCSAAGMDALGGDMPQAGGLGFGAGDVAGGDQQPLLDIGGSKDQGLEMEQGVKKNKVQVLKRVDEDMRALQSIYTDLAAAAEEQQQSFDSLESHIASATIDVERGREEISLSKYGWGQQLKRRLMYGGGAALALFIFGAMIDAS